MECASHSGIVLISPVCVFRQGQYCDICTSMNSNKAHPITNAIDGTERWWQSPPLSRGLEFNQVNVTLDLGQVTEKWWFRLQAALIGDLSSWVSLKSFSYPHGRGETESCCDGWPGNSPLRSQGADEIF